MARPRREIGMASTRPRGICNHSTYWLARPDCPDCRAMFGHIPESPAYRGNWLSKWLLLLGKAIENRAAARRRAA